MEDERKSLFVSWDAAARRGGFIGTGNPAGGDSPDGPTSQSRHSRCGPQKEASKLANEVYGRDIAKAKTKEERAALGKKLLQAGIDEQGDRAARYVLLEMAIDLAAKGGDAETAFVAVNEQAQSFEMDALKSKANALAKVEGVKGDDAAALLERSTGLIDEAVVADRYDVAKQVAEWAAVLAPKTGNSGTVQAAAARGQEVKSIEADFERGKKAQAVLASDPNNAAAYLTVGRFLCLAKGDWEKGVPMLSNSSDKALKAVADKELTKPVEPGKQVELADGWWDLAEKEKGLSQRRIYGHAADWYRKALPSLTGLMKTKVEKRLEAAPGISASVNLVNVARGAKVTANRSAPGNGALEKINDGVTDDVSQPRTSYWFAGEGRPKPDWVRLQFKKPVEVHSIRMLLPIGTSRFAAGHAPAIYEVAGFKGGQGSRLAAVANEKHPKTAPAPVPSTQWAVVELRTPRVLDGVQLTCVQTSGGSHGPVVFEIEVMGRYVSEIPREQDK